jgi:hypothetical protein
MLTLSTQLLDTVCETLTNTNTTTNVLSSNEIAGVEVDGAGILEGIDVYVEPSILSGLFQTATPTVASTATITISASAPTRSTFRERQSALSASISAASVASVNQPLLVVEGVGALDGIDVTLAATALKTILKPTTVVI